MNEGNYEEDETREEKQEKNTPWVQGGRGKNLLTNYRNNYLAVALNGLCEIPAWQRGV